MQSETPQGCTPTELPQLREDDFTCELGRVSISTTTAQRCSGIGRVRLINNDWPDQQASIYVDADELRGIATMLADFADELDRHMGKEARAPIGLDIPHWLKA